MNRRLLALGLLVPFTALTIWSVKSVGVMGILATAQTPGGAQVFADLVIALILLLTYLVPQARAEGRNPYPWVILTVCLGSFGPLLYLATARVPAVGGSATGDRSRGGKDCESPHRSGG